MYAIKIEAELLLCRFRFDMENNVGKKSILKRLNKIIEKNVLPQAVEFSTENNSNKSVLDIALSPHFTDESKSSSKSTISSLTLVKFDVKGDRKENNSHIKKKRKETSMSRKCLIDFSAHTRNPKSTGLFGISIGRKE